MLSWRALSRPTRAARRGPARRQPASALGFVPRLTSIVCWGLLAWAFLLDMLGSAVKVSDWVMDTSLLYHLALAPAVNPDWRIAGTYLGIGCAAALLGGWRFTRRDLQSN